MTERTYTRQEVETMAFAAFAREGLDLEPRLSYAEWLDRHLARLDQHVETNDD